MHRSSRGMVDRGEVKNEKKKGEVLEREEKG